MSDAYTRVEHDELLRFCTTVFQKLGLNREDAAIASDVLVAADMRGIESHGVGRLWRYRNGIKTGLMVPDAASAVVRETPSSIVLNAGGGMGAPASVRAMHTVIQKAEQTGAAFGCVHDSNHFGIAGYYAMLAMDRNMLGVAMTNTAALGVPTFGRQASYGTNPLAFCAPADTETAFVLDMSTTVVTRGRVEVFEGQGRDLPLGWAVDKTGRSAQDPGQILDDMANRIGGGMLPLGGEGETFGGHKGYGLAVMVDILCAVLAGAPFGRDIRDTATSSARVSHFFGAIRIDGFRDPSDFRRDMDTMLKRLRQSSPAAGCERVYFAGQKEFEKERECRTKGVPLLRHAYQSLCDIAREEGLVPPRQQKTGGREA